MRFLFLLIGFGVGAGTMYLLQMKDMNRLDELETELDKTRRNFADAEVEHEHRLKDAIATLQEDYQKKQDQRVLNLKTEYQAKISTLEAQINALEAQLGLAPAETSQATIHPQPEAAFSTSAASFEPPILAAAIRPLANPPVLKLSTPTGKQFEPPILAQLTKTLIQLPTTFEPPILAAVIHSRPTQPTFNLSTPTGKHIEPPILAQSTAKTIVPVSFEPPILAAVIHSRPAQPALILVMPTGKHIDPPILAQVTAI